MPILSFEGETHAEIIKKVRRWLDSVEGRPENVGAVVDMVNQASDLTKGALTILARNAPGGLSRNELVKELTRMGFEATDSTKRAVISSLDSMAEATAGDGVLKRVERARNSVLYEMNAAVAKQVLRALR
ncbi:MAG: hypothetical protein ACRD0I_05925 [Acidimicrobiales bacterium]